jgi:predicted O-methyltransferase YrrM
MKNDNLPLQVEQWYVENYKTKSLLRFETFKICLKLLYSLTPTPLIVETGTVRREDSFDQGYSTVIFGECVKLFGGKLITIDIDENNINLSKKITEKFSDSIQYEIGDSITVLEKLKNEINNIDLIYLDSFDCPITGDSSAASQHNLNEFLQIEDSLSDECIILIDDIGFENGGKGKFTHEYLNANQYGLIAQLHQSIWAKETSNSRVKHLFGKYVCDILC